VVCDRAGGADFERLHSREHDRQAFLWAFDLLELDGEDLRPTPLSAGTWRHQVRGRS
jgi:ATP-dependent DNA ligase